MVSIMDSDMREWTWRLTGGRVGAIKGGKSGCGSFVLRKIWWPLWPHGSRLKQKASFESEELLIELSYMSFQNLGLSDSVVHGVQRMGYVDPSPIQLRAIPLILSGRDLIASAQTGTGKTAAFGLPLLSLLDSPRATAPLPDP